MWRQGLQQLLRAGGGGQGEATVRGVAVSAVRGTVIIERWWQVPLSKEGKPARLHPRRHRVYRLVEDTKHKPQDKLELILMQAVPKLGDRGETVWVKKSVGRNRLLPQGLAVYTSPENQAAFEQERKLLREGKPEERRQTQSGERTLELLRNSRLTVRMKNNVKWELNKEIVCRHFLKELNLFVPPEALRIPDEPITQWGEHWCEVTVSDLRLRAALVHSAFTYSGGSHPCVNKVNGIDTVRLPMSVMNFELPKTRRYKEWLSRQQRKEELSAEGEKEEEEES